MNNHYTYFLILSLSLGGPLLLSFDKKVAFYKKWKYVLPAMILPAILYIIWDSWFTSLGIWSFNENYITSIKFFGLPLEEILFFFVVPYCCTFIYECIRCYFPKIKDSKLAALILKLIAVALFITALILHNRYYTFYTFLFTSLFISIIYVFRNYFRKFNNAVFLIAYIIILIPFLVVNGFLTAIPVVLYNDAQNLALRIYTIPFEDVFYGMLLVMMNIIIFEKLRNAHQ
ncbi:MAG: lycopene cyclase domain-containing protein [Ferruginibacter sp.]